MTSGAAASTVRFVEVISPGGFEGYFFDLAEPFNRQDEPGMGAAVGRYGLERPETIGELSARYGLRPPF